MRNLSHPANPTNDRMKNNERLSREVKLAPIITFWLSIGNNGASPKQRLICLPTPSICGLY